MSARDEHLAGVLCHCEIDPDGHPLGTPGCSSEVKVGGRRSATCRRPHGDIYGISTGPCTCHGPARGTCPGCGKTVKVVRLNAWVASDGEVEFSPLERRPGWHQLYGAIRPGMAPHRVGGRECPGTGQVPTETTFREGTALAAWLRAQREGAA